MHWVGEVALTFFGSNLYMFWRWWKCYFNCFKAVWTVFTVVRRWPSPCLYILVLPILVQAWLAFWDAHDVVVALLALVDDFYAVFRDEVWDGDGILGWGHYPWVWMQRWWLSSCPQEGEGWDEDVITFKTPLLGFTTWRLRNSSFFCSFKMTPAFTTVNVSHSVCMALKVPSGSSSPSVVSKITCECFQSFTQPPRFFFLLGVAWVPKWSRAVRPSVSAKSKQFRASETAEIDKQSNKFKQRPDRSIWNNSKSTLNQQNQLISARSVKDRGPFRSSFF